MGLNLGITIRLSQDFFDLPGGVFIPTFQIIDGQTNVVVVNNVGAERPVRFLNSLSFNVNKGNTWSPNPGDWDTPEKWGLNPGRELYGFRGIVLGFQRVGPGISRIDVFAVSDIRWFRLIPSGRL